LAAKLTDRAAGCSKSSKHRDRRSFCFHDVKWIRKGGAGQSPAGCLADLQL